VRPALAERVARLRLVDVADLAPAHAREEVVVADLRDAAAMHAAIAGADGVVHLGAIPDEAPFADLLAVNVAGTQHVLEGARRTGARRVVFASSNHAIGGYPAGQPLDADVPTRPDSFYGVSKVAGEALGRMYADKFGLAVVNVRIGTFAPEPPDRRALSTWLSPDDCRAVFLAAMTAPDVTYATIYGISCNTRRWWDHEPGRALGYEPRDDAERFAPALAAGALPPLQGGGFADAAYTLERQPGGQEG
jgi:uronate dehydrogenase